MQPLAYRATLPLTGFDRSGSFLKKNLKWANLAPLSNLLGYFLRSDLKILKSFTLIFCSVYFGLLYSSNIGMRAVHNLQLTSKGEMG